MLGGLEVRTSSVSINDKSIQRAQHQPKHKNVSNISHSALPISDKMTTSPSSLLSSVRTQRAWGAATNEHSRSSFVARWNVTLMTEQGGRYHTLIFYLFFTDLTIQDVSQRNQCTHLVTLKSHVNTDWDNKGLSLCVHQQILKLSYVYTAMFSPPESQA